MGQTIRYNTWVAARKDLQIRLDDFLDRPSKDKASNLVKAIADFLRLHGDGKGMPVILKTPNPAYEEVLRNL